MPKAGRGHPFRQEVRPEPVPPEPDSLPPRPLDKTPFVVPAPPTVCQKVTIVLLLKKKKRKAKPVPHPHLQSQSRQPGGTRGHPQGRQEEACTTAVGSEDPGQVGWIKRRVEILLPSRMETSLQPFNRLALKGPYRNQPAAIFL